MTQERLAPFAALPGRYAAMQRSGDTYETAVIRYCLLNPAQPPLSLGVLAREENELAPVFGRIAGASDDPQYGAAKQLAAHALFTCYTLYGDPVFGEVNQIVGKLEKPEYGVRAFYHNAFGILQDAHDLQTHFDNLGGSISAADRLDGLVADIYTDIVYGNGRQSDTPNGYDELLSAELAYEHARQLGYPGVRAERLRQIVLGTRFDEKTRSQPGRFSDDLVVRAVTAVDLQRLARRGEGVTSSQDITLENLMSRRYHVSQVLSHAARREGAVLRTRQEGLDFIRAHYDMPVEGHPHAATLGSAYAYEMLGSAQFHETYLPPEDWTLADLRAQQENARAIRQEAFAMAG